MPLLRRGPENSAYAPSLVYVMMGAGALMGLSMMVLTVGPLYEMWLYDR